MNRIEIKELRLLNFKGIRNQVVTFDGNTNIYGDNGLGKSTLFDSFVWLLFGKNAEDKKDFSIKTYDADGVVIPKLPHEVSAIIKVGEDTISLRRCFKEKWVKRRGTATEEFTGHEEERYWNDVPCSLKEWQIKIDSIISEQIFKTITNPFYFVSQKSDVQRNMLLSMVDAVSNEDVISISPEFGKLFEMLNGKTIEEFKREIGAKKRIIKDAVSTIPSRIDERKRDIVEGLDEEGLKTMKADAQQKIEELESILMDVRKKKESESKHLVELTSEKNRLLLAISNRKAEMQKEASAAAVESNRKYSELKVKVTSLKYEIESLQSRYGELCSMKNEKETAIQKLRDEYASLYAEQLQFSDNEFLCPTCGRLLDDSDIETRKAHMLEEFNRKKVERINANVRVGKETKAFIESLAEKINNVEVNLAQKTEEYDTLMLQFSKMSEVNIEMLKDDAFAEDATINELSERIDSIDAELSHPNTGCQDEQTDDVKHRLESFRDMLSSISADLAKAEANRTNQNRIVELEKELRQQSEELAKLEGIEFTIQQFNKTKVEMVEGRINSLFRLVKWKLYDTQINGGEVECCIPMVEGVPFADTNKTNQVNAGLDIITAISHHINGYAPIFIDNAESFNTLIPMECQIIRLIVSNDKSLKVEKA